MKSAVIGANSFIGNYLVSHLKKNNAEEVISLAISNVQSEYHNPADDEMDICRGEQVRDMLEKISPDRVFFLNAVESVSYAKKNPKELLSSHVIGLLNILEAVRSINVNIPVLVAGYADECDFTGWSSFTAGKTEGGSSQNMVTAARSCQNMMSDIYIRAYDMKIMTVLMSNNIGPGQSVKSLVSDICRQIAQIEAGKREGEITADNLDIAADFIDVRDTVRALDMLCSDKFSGIYHIGSGKSRTIRELADMLKSRTNIDFRIAMHKDERKMDNMPKVEADMSQIHSAVGWKPEISVEKTVSDMYEYWKEQI